MTFTNLYTKDTETGTYTYGHTKELYNTNEILTIHNLVLFQVLSHMHKIYHSRSPAHILTYFTAHYPPTRQTDTAITEATDQTLHRQGIDVNNILDNRQTTSKYFTVPERRLATQKISIISRAPSV